MERKGGTREACTGPVWRPPPGGMFGGCSAWFSQSVPPELCRLWVDEGGAIADLEAADYIFSSNASHPDTKRYMGTTVWLEIRNKIGSFIWEQITSPLERQSTQSIELKDKNELERSEGPGTSETGKLTYVPLQRYPTSNMVTGYTSAREMKKFSGAIRDFIPGCSGYLAYWIPDETNISPDVKMKSESCE